MQEIRSTVFLIRHGNTELNKKKAFRGHIDVPLDGEGLEQAEKTAKFLRDIDFDIIYSSPLSRAMQTADIIKDSQKKEVKVITEPGFLDISFGEWEGKTYDEAQAQYPDVFKVWAKEPHKAKVPGGETLSEVKKRARETLNDIVSDRNGSTIGIVSHRMINKLLINSILGMDGSKLWLIKQDPCCINIFQYKHGMFFASKLNYNFHIMGLKESINIFDF